MTPADIPFNVGYHFDDSLREVPDDPADMQRAVRFLREQLRDAQLDEQEQMQALGLLGVYQRILGHLASACDDLRRAIDLARRLNMPAALTANRIRLAHVYQWQGEFEEADNIYRAVIAKCERNPESGRYLDFALQHYGKSLFDQQRYDEAIRCFTRALEIRLASGDQQLIASTRLALDAARRRIPQP